MGYIAFASAKGSPGVTTAVAALAATWPVDRELVVVEVDPAGGDLAVRFDLAPEPGLVSLAAAGRRELGPDTLVAHTQDLAGLTGDDVRPRRVLVAPVSADQAAAALTALRGPLSATLAALDLDVLVDCGRLDPGSPAFEVATKADLLVMVAQPVVAEVHHLASRLVSVGSAAAVSVMLVGDKPYTVAEVAEAVGASALGSLAVDPRAAVALAGGHAGSARALRRSGLLRDAGAIADGLAQWLGPPPAGASAGSPEPALATAGSPEPAFPAPIGPPVSPGVAPAGRLPSAGPPPAAPAPAAAPPPAVRPPNVPPPPAHPPAGPPPPPAGRPSAGAAPVGSSPVLPPPLDDPWSSSAPPTSSPAGPDRVPPAAPSPGPTPPGPPAAVPASPPRAAAVATGGDEPGRDGGSDALARLRPGLRRERPASPPAKHFRRDDAEERGR